MLALDHAGMLDDQSQYIRTKHNHDKIQVYERSSLLFVFNWHCTESYTEYAVYVKNCQSVRVILSTDDVEFGGHARVEHREYTTSPIDPFCCKFLLYIPNRCAIVLKINLNMS